MKRHIKNWAELLEDAMQNCTRLFFVDELKNKDIRKLIEACIKSETVRKAIDERKYAELDTSGLFFLSGSRGDVKLSICIRADKLQKIHIYT